MLEVRFTLVASGLGFRYTTPMHTHLISDEHLEIIKTWLGSGSINIFGLPFAGKDTHGHVLASLLGAKLLSGGDILRNSVIPPHVKAELDAGKLIPTEDYLRIVTPYLSQDDFQGAPLILSSVGRWIGEEVGVIEATAASQHPIKAVLYLPLSEDSLFTRWEKSQIAGDRGGRTDDSDRETVATRIAEFNEKTLPVIEEYRKRGLLIEVNSDATKQEVVENIFARLLMLATTDV